MVPICSHCPNCSTQWSLVVLTAVPNAPICSTQLSSLQCPIVPTAVPNVMIYLSIYLCTYWHINSIHYKLINIHDLFINKGRLTEVGEHFKTRLAVFS